MITETELVTDAPEQAQLVAVVAQNNLPAEAAQTLRTSFAPLFKSAHDLVQQSRAVTVTDATQTAQIKLSRAFRLELRKVRVAGETLRKTLKEES